MQVQASRSLAPVHRHLVPLSHRHNPGIAPCQRQRSFGLTQASGASARARQQQQQQQGGWIRPGGLLLLAVPLTTFGLGVWQTKRRRWKLDLIKKLEEKTQAEPVPLPTDLSDLGARMEYCKVAVSGVFEHEREFYIGPRSRINQKEDSGGGGLFGSSEGIGFHVVTPLLLGDGTRILVNRGWVPKRRLDPATRTQGQVQGQVRLVGVVRDTEQRPQFQPKDQSTGNKLLYRDIDVIAERLDAAPVFLDASAESSVPGGPIGGQTRITLRNDHFEYMLTWFSLSAATLYMWVKKFVVLK